MITTSPSLLPSPPDMLTGLRAALPQFRQIQWLDETNSTNADLLHKARTTEQSLARPWLLGTHLQTQGRGRAGRTWQNRAGANLMFSCALDIFLPPHQLATLSPLAGLAACEALRQLIGPEHQSALTVKWPNDIQWHSSKLAGILVEVTRAGTARLSSDHHVAIIGIGINLDDARALSQSLNRQVADWAEIARQDAQAAQASPMVLVAGIARAWYEALNDVIREGFADFPARYARLDALAGQHINVLDNGRIVHAGIACGVNSSGQLRIRAPEGETAISVGEISVRAHT